MRKGGFDIGGGGIEEGQKETAIKLPDELCKWMSEQRL